MQDSVYCSDTELKQTSAKDNRSFDSLRSHLLFNKFFFIETKILHCRHGIQYCLAFPSLRQALNCKNR